MIPFKMLAAFAGVITLAGCGENAFQDITQPDPGARIKFFNFAVPTTTSPTPAVNFYANGVKMNGVFSATGVDTLGIGYGGVTAGAFYSAIAPGQYTITAKGARPADSTKVIATLAASIQQGKHYSFYTSGAYNATAGTADGFIVEDDFPAAIAFDTVYVRFVHASHNAAPMILYAKRTANPITTPADTATYQIGGPVAYKSGGAFVAIPSGTYNLFSRYPGATTNAILRPTTVTYSVSRIYTVTAMGDINVASGTGVRTLDNTVNR